MINTLLCCPCSPDAAARARPLVHWASAPPALGDHKEPPAPQPDPHEAAAAVVQDGDLAEDHHDELAPLDNPTMEPFPRPFQKLLLPASAAAASGLDPVVVEKRPVEQPAGGGPWVLPVSSRELAEVRIRLSKVPVAGASADCFGASKTVQGGRKPTGWSHIQVEGASKPSYSEAHDSCRTSSR